ncbi:50S ribosomal protein L11 methyltransferase [Psychromonas sp. CD1]|uniref:50S ribosomal protein L11 methyltransferase n=1 Tax=Psychromonas sp. CD1 TaxID=1979839 RepID=UPI000B9C09F8|nr:50S ribosomal protein L11 methyltransferase [Psychromonas sp. CD1]
MPWIQLKLNANAKNAEAIGELLMQNGALSATFTDAKDTPVFEPLPGETRLWGDTDITGLFEADSDMQSIIKELKTSPLIDNDFAYKIEPLEDKDWEREWMDNFHPMQFGKRLWICPSWKPIPDENAVNVLLDPGLAFGTGTHPTTALCLTWLEGQDLRDKVIIDFGCGSGILAIAALKLGAKRVIGIDIDPQAITASRDNATRNGVSEQLELYLPDDLPVGIQADVLVANILAGPLRQLSTQIEALVSAQGSLALSGILDSQADELIGVYSKWFVMKPANIEQEWAQLSGVKRCV